MKKVLIWLVVIVVVAVAGVLAAAMMQPDRFRVARSLAIDAPPERIYPLIADFNQWSLWSPFDKLDPAMKREISGPAGSVGSTYAWQGNSAAGAGKMTIDAAQPPTRIDLDLHFLEPLEGRNTATFTLEPQGAATDVTWAMEGPSPLIFKVMSLFFDVDASIGEAFEAGLKSLKSAAETPPAG